MGKEQDKNIRIFVWKWTKEIKMGSISDRVYSFIFPEAMCNGNKNYPGF